MIEFRPRNVRLKAAKEVFYVLAEELKKLDKLNHKTYLIINNFGSLNS